MIKGRSSRGGQSKMRGGQSTMGEMNNILLNVDTLYTEYIINLLNVVSDTKTIVPETKSYQLNVLSDTKIIVPTTKLSDLTSIQFTRLELLLHNVMPHPTEIKYMRALLSSDMQFKYTQHIKLVKNKFEDINQLLIGGDNSSKKKTNKVYTKQDIVDVTPENVNIDELSVLGRIKNIVDIPITMSLSKLITMVMLVCFLGACLLNPLLEYVGFDRLLQSTQKVDVPQVERMLMLPKFYSDEYYSENKKNSKDDINRDIVSYIKFDLTDDKMFYNALGNNKVSPLGAEFIHVLQNKTFLMTKILPLIEFTNKDVINVISEKNNNIQSNVHLYEKLYNVLQNQHHIHVNLLENENVFNFVKTYFSNYFNSLFIKGSFVEIDKDVLDTLDGTISRQFHRKKAEVIEYNRQFLSKFRGEIIDLILMDKMQYIEPEAAHTYKSRVNNQIKKLIRDVNKDYIDDKSLDKAKKIHYCLSQKDIVSADEYAKSTEMKGSLLKILNVSKKIKCFQYENVVSQSEIDYAITFQKFNLFFNTIGITYNTNIEYFSKQQNIDKIKGQVSKQYHDFLGNGINGFRNEFHNIVVTCFTRAQITTEEAFYLNNYKSVISLNMFDYLLDLAYNNLEIVSDIPGSKMIKTLVSKVKSFALDSASKAGKNAISRIILKLQHSILEEEMLFKHTNFDTDILISFVQNLSMKESFISQSYGALSRTNIDMFVSIQMKKLVLKLFHVFTDDTLGDKVNTLATEALTSMLYIIPYYTHKSHTYENDLMLAGGKNTKQQLRRPVSGKNATQERPAVSGRNVTQNAKQLRRPFSGKHSTQERPAVNRRNVKEEVSPKFQH